MLGVLLLLAAGCEKGPTPTAVPTNGPPPVISSATMAPNTAVPLSPTATLNYDIPTGTPIPTRPPTYTAEELIATIQARTAEPFTAVAVKDNLAFVGYGSSLVILDISTPSQPRLLSQLPLSNRIKKIQVMEEALFLVLDFSNDDETRITLQTVGFSNPANPVILDSYQPDFLAVDAVWIGEIAYLVGWPSRWEAINVADPAHMFKAKVISEVDYWDCQGGGSNTYAVEEVEGYLHLFQGYCRSSGRYVNIWDIADPFNPVQLGQLRIHYSSAPMDMAYLDNLAFTRIGGFMRVFDISDWDNVGLLSDLPFPDGDAPALNGKLLAVDDTIYMASTNGLLLIQQTERFKTEVVNQLYPGVYLSDIVEANGYIYLTDWGGGLIILNAADPAHPLEVGRWQG